MYPDDLREPKGSADDRFEVAVGKVVEYVLLGLQELLWKFVRIRNPFEETVPLDGQVFAERIAKRIGGG